MTESNAYTRRQFLKTGMVLASTAWTLPSFLERSALAMSRPSTAVAGAAGLPDQRVLVIVQLSGGNDGLNTVIPYRHELYYRNRPRIAVARDQVLSLGPSQEVGLHPRLRPLMELMDNGAASVIQGVGYPNPNRSHFASMDIWHTGDTLGRNGYGWLGRAMDEKTRAGAAAASRRSGDQKPSPNGMLALGREAPLATIGRKARPVTFEQANLFRWFGEDIDPEMAQSYGMMVTPEELAALASLRDQAGADPSQGDEAAFVKRTSLDARVESARIRQAVARGAATTFPNSPLARDLQTVAAMIRAQMPTRVYYVGMGGFDTHAGQSGRHDGLLGQFAQAMKAFDAELRATGHHDRVITMAFSEFGRRVSENASAGTDHGAAGPVFLFGSHIKPGLIGPHPSLDKLERGDLAHQLDFRSVYASLLQHWLTVDPSKVLGPAFKPANVLAI